MKYIFISLKKNFNYSFPGNMRDNLNKTKEPPSRPIYLPFFPRKAVPFSYNRFRSRSHPFRPAFPKISVSHPSSKNCNNLLRDVCRSSSWSQFYPDQVPPLSSQFFRALPLILRIDPLFHSIYLRFLFQTL